MDKITEALSKLVPGDQIKEVSDTVKEMVEGIKTDLESEYNKKLEEAYAELSKEVKDGEQVAEQGYHEAYGIIQDLRNRLDSQRAEFDSALEEGYEEAYQMLISERGKSETISNDLYGEYDKKLSEMKEFMIDKIDEFLQVKGKEIYEQARRDISNDPRMVEHKVTLSKVIDTVSDYISDEEFALSTSNKLQEVSKQFEEMKGQMRILEARNIRISTENTKLNESVKKQAALLTEATNGSEADSKKERIEKAKNATGRGKQVTEEKVEVIREHGSDKVTEQVEEVANPLGEGFDANVIRTLAGIPAKK